MKDKRWIAGAAKKLKDKLFVIDFCNLKDEEFNNTNILDLQKKYDVFYREEHRKRGYSDSCFPGKDIDEYGRPRHHWMLVEDGEEIAIFKKEFGDLVVLPSEDHHTKLFDFLKSSQTIYKKFLNRCEKGDLDINFLKELDARLQPQYTIDADENWGAFLKPKKIVGHLVPSFESYIDWQIINIFLQGKGEVFKQVRVCEWHNCRKYFLKYHGGKYCSTTCANRQTSYKYRQNPSHRRR